MKRHKSPIPKPRPKKTKLNQQHLDSQQPKGPACIILHETPSNSSSATLPSTPSSAELGVKELLVCQPVAVALLSALPLSHWIKLRRVSRCWRDAVDGQLKSLKELDMFDLLGLGYNITRDEEKIVSLLEFFSTKALAIESLILGAWFTVAPPEVLNRFRKLKRLDEKIRSGGLQLDSKVLQVLEKLRMLEALESISLPSEPVPLPPYFRPLDPEFEATYNDRLQLLIGRLESLQSLSFGTSRKHPALLEDLRNPEKLTQLSIGSASLPMLQSLPRFINLRHLKINCSDDTSPAHVAAMESALEQLKALRSVEVGRSISQSIKPACLPLLAQLPHLERLIAMSDSLPKGVQWIQFKQLSFLELGVVNQSFLGYINQITTLTCLKLAAEGRVKFSCSLPQLQTLCLSGTRYGGIFHLDFQPACSNIKNLTLLTHHSNLLYLTPGLLKLNSGIKRLKVGWQYDGSKAQLGKLKSIAKACKSLETVELPLARVEISQMASFFVDICPLLKNLKMGGNYLEDVEAMEKFRHLNISTCCYNDSLWLLH